MHLKQKLIDKLNHWFDKLFSSIFGGSILDTQDDEPQVTPTTPTEPQTPAQEPVTPVTPAPTTPTSDPVDPDEIPYSTLDFCWGGYKGKNNEVKARIKGLKISGSKMSYSWASGGCENLGASSKTDYKATVACLFCRIDGKWKGGKFDFISTSRTSRSFENIFDSYNGWDPKAIEKASAFAFVICSVKNGSRTNVITTAGKGARTGASGAVLEIIKDIFSWLVPAISTRRQRKDAILLRIEEAKANQGKALHEGRVTDAAAYGQEVKNLYEKLNHIGWFSCLLFCLLLTGCTGCSSSKPKINAPAVLGERIFIVKPNTTVEVPELVPPARKWYLVDDIGLCQWLDIPVEGTK